MTGTHIFIFSGLGANEHVFERLNLGVHPHTFIQWEQPMRNESIEQYAHRLLKQINVERPILLGLSFGGMVAVEVAKLMETENVILLSSAETRSDIPFYFRWMGTLGLHCLLPIRLLRLLKQPSCLANWFFGTTNDSDRVMLAQQLRQTDPVFLAWAIVQIVRWGNKVQHPRLVHITGTADRILPCWAKRFDVSIDGGGHLMVYNRADEVSKAIAAHLAAMP